MVFCWWISLVNDLIEIATAHAEVGLLERMHDEGLLKGVNLEMTVRGQKVCDYCKSDIKDMLMKTDIQSITIYEEFSGKYYFWEQGMRKIMEKQ